MIDNFSVIMGEVTLRGIIGGHVIPVIVNTLVMGAVWILFAIYLYIEKKDSRLSFLIILGLFITAFLGNEIIRPVLFHFRAELDLDLLKLYLPEIENHRFPAGFFMMSASSICLIRYADYSLEKPALLAAAFITFINLHAVFSYTIDVVLGILLGIALGKFLIRFYEKKVEEENELMDLEDKFHF